MLLNISSLLWIIATLLLIISAIYFIFYFKFTNYKVLKDVKFFDRESIKLLNISLAGKIGVGSISGIAISIIIGGKGTILWIWLSSFFLSIFTYLETKAGIKYKEKNNNDYIGGTYIILKKILKKKKLSLFYLYLIIFTFLISFILIQSNTIIVTLTSFLSVNKNIIIILLTIVVLLSIRKEIKSISSIVSYLVPIMGFIYLLIGLLVLFNNRELLLTIIVDIFKESISIKSLLTIPFIIGFQRSIFSNETGMGTTSMILALSKNNNYKQEYFFQLIGLYYISLVICTISAFIIMTTNYEFININNINGIEIINYAFLYHFGSFGIYLSSLIITMFAFSTIITSYYYGKIAINCLIHNNNNTFIKIIVIIVIVLSAFINPVNIWALVDLSTGLLTIINVYSLIKVRNQMKEE